MNKLLLSAALASSVLSTSALAQQANILVVDSNRILADCNACKSAANQIQTKQNTARTRAQTLQTQLQTEGKPIQEAVDALNGKEPDAALRQRITAFQTKEKSAQTELDNLQQSLQSTVANVQQQLGNKLITVVEQIRARRNAAVVLAKNSTLANDNAIDVTTEALTALNTQLPSVNVTPLPAQQQRTQPQGR